VVGIGHTPAPAPQLGNLTLCNGSVSSKISFNLADTTTFAGWRSSNPSIGLTSHGADTIPAFTAVNSGNVPVTDTITVTVKGRGYAWFPSGPWLIKYDIARHIVVDTINMPHSDIALQCAFSPDGSVVYVYSRQTGTEYRSVYAFSASTDQLVRTYPYRDQINDYHQGEMCISPDGQYLYVASSFDNLI
jgi:WD40 repeat protein